MVDVRVEPELRRPLPPLNASSAIGSTAWTAARRVLVSNVVRILVVVNCDSFIAKKRWSCGPLVLCTTQACSGGLLI